MSAEAEILVAATSVLVPQPANAQTLMIASVYTDTWPARVEQYLRGQDIRRFKPPAPRDPAQVRKQLARVITDTEASDLVRPISAIDPLLAGDFLATLRQARQMLLGAYPLEEVESVLAPEEIEPSQDAIARWLAVVAVVESPDRVLDEMEMGSLEKAQAENFKACYPQLWMELWGEVQATMNSMVAEGIKHLPPDRESTVRTLGRLGWSAPLLPPTELPAPAEEKGGTLDVSKQQAPAEKLIRPLG